MITEAIVIRTFPLREHDLFVVLYCRDRGRVSAVARGALRRGSRQAIALDEGNFIRCKLIPSHSGISILTSAQAERSWFRVKEATLPWSVAAFFLEAVHVMTYEEQPDTALWDILIALLGMLDQKDRDPLEILRQGQAKFVEALGYGRQVIPLSAGAVRTALDEKFEHIAQRRFCSIELVYRVAARR